MGGGQEQEEILLLKRSEGFEQGPDNGSSAFLGPRMAFPAALLSSQSDFQMCRDQEEPNSLPLSYTQAAPRAAISLRTKASDTAVVLRSTVTFPTGQRPYCSYIRGF